MTGPSHRLPLEPLAIAVVGAGRIGSELLRNLGLMGSRHVDVFERDARIADALRIRYSVYDGDFWDTLTLARLQAYDFAVCTVDSLVARRRMNQKCLVANVNLVQAWTEGTLALAGAYPFAALPDSACFDCESADAAAAMPVPPLKLSVEEATCAAGDATRVATASVAGALAASLIARIASGSHGSVARRATLDATAGHGASLEVRRNPRCPRCGSLQRPVPIVRTHNRWAIPACVARLCPEVLNQRLQLSDEIDGLPVESCCVRELAALFHGGPVPAKFALSEAGGRVFCLDFEERESGPAPDTLEAAGRHTGN